MSEPTQSILHSFRGQLAALLSKTHSGKRDLYEIFGYRSHIKNLDYDLKYKRGDIAARIVTAYPDAVWSKPPKLIENSDAQEETPFEKDFQELATRLKLWHYIRRADILAQKGRYSILFIGINDGQKDLTQPAGKGDILYLMPYGESSCHIQDYEKDVTNERFGKPKLYRIQTTSEDSQGSVALDVHYSRVIHIAERTLESDIFGKPILESIFNRLEDLEKTVGGSAEVLWMNSRGGLSVEADKDVEIRNPGEVKEDIDNFVHQLSRVIRTKGMTVNPVNFAVASPKDHVDVILMLISGTTGIPKRILTGAEQGSLASSQDQNNWNERVDERRMNFCESEILAQLYDKFVELGVIPDGKMLEWQWPSLKQVSPKDAADIAETKSRAIAAYSGSPEADTLIPPQQFVEEILEMEYREDEVEDMMGEEDNDIDESIQLGLVEDPEKEEGE